MNTADGVIGELAVRLLPWVLGIMGTLIMILIGVLAYEARQMRQNWEQDAEAIRLELKAIGATLSAIQVSWTEKLGLISARVRSLEVRMQIYHPQPPGAACVAEQQGE